MVRDGEEGQWVVMVDDEGRGVLLRRFALANNKSRWD